MNFLEFCDTQRHTLIDLFEFSKDSDRSFTFVSDDLEDESISWRDFYKRSLRIAGYLQNFGLTIEDKLSYFGMTRGDALNLLQATWLVGAIPTVLPLPLRLLSIEDFVAQIKRRLTLIDPKLIVIDDAVLEFIDTSSFGFEFLKLSDLINDSAKNNYPYFKPKVSVDNMAILQFTSGSTGEPKGVPLTHKNIVSHIKSMSMAAKFNNESDTIVTWLPLYHDMGFIGMTLTPMATGCSLVLARPQDFTKNPINWAKWIETYRGTITAGPNFAYAHLTKLLKNSEHIDLSSLRIALNGAENIDPTAIREFTEVAKYHHFNEKAVFCAFGMAESTLAVTFVEPETGLEVDIIDRSILENSKRALPPSSVTDPAWIQECVVLGKPISGIEIRICDEHTNEILEDRHAGEIQVRGESFTKHYYKNENQTYKHFVNGWFKTGDLGYIFDGKLVVLCRLADKLELRSGWLTPEEIESTVSKHPFVRPGNVVAFQVSDLNTEPTIVIVAEYKKTDNVDETAEEIKTIIRHKFGLEHSRVYLIEPGSLPKTTSGKLQRNLTRSLYLTRALKQIE